MSMLRCCCRAASSSSPAFARSVAAPSLRRRHLSGPTAGGASPPPQPSSAPVSAADADPLAMAEYDGGLAYVEADPFAPPGVEKRQVKVRMPDMSAMLSNQEDAGPPSRQDDRDPSNWTCEQVVAWIREHYADEAVPEIDEDLVAAFVMNDNKGKDLMNILPNSLFKEMRKHYRKPEEYVPKVDEVLLRETVLLSFKYGGQDSFW